MTVGQYPVGKPGQPWGEAEIVRWRAMQRKSRSYAQDVGTRIAALADRFDRFDYGQLRYGEDVYALQALQSRAFDPTLPAALITGGVHGYETSGVDGALLFLEQHAARYAGKVNLLVVPCVSPWGYEHCARWNYDAVDPNRGFGADVTARECVALLELVRRVDTRFDLHIDLHETTESDLTEFGPAKAARDGVRYVPETIPDGFYLVADSDNPQLDFQAAVIAAVERETHIATSDGGGIYGVPLTEHGVVELSVSSLGVCASISGAPFTTTTEVIPARGTAARDARTQAIAVNSALDFVIGG